MQIPVHQMNGIAFLEGFGNAGGGSVTPRTFSEVLLSVKSALMCQSYIEDAAVPLSNHAVIIPLKGFFV